MHVLGISSLAHDPAAALLGEQGIEAAIEEGKLQRTRESQGLPRAAIRFCLERGHVAWNDIATVAVTGHPVRTWLRRALFRARTTLLAPVSGAYYQSRALGELGRDLNNLRILRLMDQASTSRQVLFDHQLCHAASAFFASPFDRALILTLDEKGDGRCGLFAEGAGTELRELHSISFPHSLAWIYSQVTQLLGFRPDSDEHKTQWLSIAGEPVFAHVFLEMLRRGSGPWPRLNPKFFRRGYAEQFAFSDELFRCLGIPNQPAGNFNEKVRADIAASLQQACNVVLTELVESQRRRYGARFLCLAGGLFLNPLLVSVLERGTGFEQIFVQPASGNEGTALGAAWLAWHHLLKRPRAAPMSRLDWGPSYSNDEIKQVLDNCKASYRWTDSEDKKIEATLRLLRAGKIVAWFQGAAEFGPRALGHRSLLASPWAPYVKENLNDYVKHRESFRPFALSVPEEDCSRHFECSPAARFMATMGLLRQESREILRDFRLPGDLVRLHVVEQATNPILWKLLKRFGENAPAPVLVNTSFNLFGEPLVITPRDAVRSYFCSGADALVAGNFLLSKS